MTKDDMIRLAHEAGWGYANNQDGYDPLWKFGELVAAAEREACAKVCEDISSFNEFVDDFYSDMYAAAIRARGQE